MFNNYSKITLRTILKNKQLFFINISGLSLSLVCCILIMLWVQDELNFDKFSENSNNIYRVIKEDNFEGEKSFSALTSPVLAETIQQNIPEVMAVSRLYQKEVEIKYKNMIIEENRLTYTDQAFLKMFSMKFIRGNAQSALNNPNSIIISEKLSNQIFGNRNPAGALLQVNNKAALEVTGVFQDLPGNSSLQFNIIAPFSLLKNEGLKIEEWSYDEFLTFIMLSQDATAGNISSRFNKIIKSQLNRKSPTYFLQSLKDIHLQSSSIKHDPLKHGNSKYVNIFSSAALIMLIIACINYINLTTASSFKRLKEIGIRKVMGAEKRNLILQFTFESTALFFMALITAGFLVEIILPAYNEFTGKELQFFTLNNFPVYGVLILLTILSGIVSSCYPVYTITKYQSSVVSHFKSGRNIGGFKLRKSLVVIQFVLSTFFVISMITIQRQNDFLQTKDLGFAKDELIYIPFQIRSDSRSSFELIRNELLKNPDIKGVSSANNILTGLYSGVSNVRWEGQKPDEKLTIFMCTCGSEFIETTGMKLLEGRSFSDENNADSQASVILNRSAVEAMNLNSPIGKRISFYGDRKVIGVVENFHFKSLYQEIEPIMMLVDPVCRYIFIRINTDKVPSTLSYIEQLWKKNLPERQFSYNFLGDSINNLYKQEQEMSKIINYFTAFALFISGLGLFGLILFIAEKRNKEIGIRKVLGASVMRIVIMLTKDFTGSIIIANLIAWPLAYYLLNRWLEDFAYRIPLSWWMFVISGCITLLTAFLVIAHQALKAGSADPVNSLRCE